MGNYSFNGTKVMKKMNPDVGSHGSRVYPFFTAYNVSNNYTPYFSVGLGIRANRFFEFSLSGVYSYYKYKFNYEDVIEKYNYQTPNYDRTISTIDGTVTNHDIRFEFAPIVRICNTKIVFGIINIDFIQSNKKMNLGTTTEYSVISKQHTGTDGQHSTDSIVSIKNIADYAPSFYLRDFIYFPISIGIEQEIPIKRLRYIVGLKAIYTNRINNGSIVGYVGVRLSEAYTWQKDRNKNSDK